MTVNFRTSYSGAAAQGQDIDDLFVRKDVFTSGNLWTWGSNGSGQLGNNSVSSRSSPGQTVATGVNWKEISISTATSQISNSTHIASIKTDGTLWTWGNNGNGQLGNNTLVNRSSPGQTVSTGTNWKQVSCGSDHIACIKTDGTLWLWGLGQTGQLGDNSFVNKSSPVQTVATGANWKLVDAAVNKTACIKTDGTLWIWGQNFVGEMGDNTLTLKSSPVQTVSTGSNWKQISCGHRAMAAIKTDGTLWTWGDNTSGQLGTNDNLARSSPGQTIAGGTNWKQVVIPKNASTSAFGGVCYSVKTDGTLWTWGNNSFGSLGTNDNLARSSPGQTIAGGTNWKYVFGSPYQVASTKTDGTLWTWGDNPFGPLGTNNLLARSSPGQTVAGGTNWKSISMGSFAIAGITDDT